MTAEDVLGLLDLLASHGIHGRVDGGWGVDALLGVQTREHDDLDLVLCRSDVPQARALLEEDGFEVERDWLPSALALRHRDGRGVDLHPIDPSADGGGDQQLQDGGWFHYSAPTAGGIGGRRVRCCTIETQIETHLGYAPDEHDRADMRLLAARFGCRLPEPYAGPGAN